MATVPGCPLLPQCTATPGSPSIIVGIIIDLVGCAVPPFPFGGHHLAVNSHTTKTSTAQFLLPFDTCSLSHQRLSCSTVHNQVSPEGFPGMPLPMPRPRRTGHSTKPLQTDSSFTVCKNVNPEKTAGAVPSLLCCFSGHSAFQ